MGSSVRSIGTSWAPACKGVPEKKTRSPRLSGPTTSATFSMKHLTSSQYKRGAVTTTKLNKTCGCQRSGPQLFRDGLARNGLVGIGVGDLHWPGLGPRHDLKARVEIDHRRCELLQDICIAFKLRRPVRNLGFERFRPHHGLLQVGAVDRERQIGLLSLEALDVGERRVLKLDDELLAVVRRDEVHRETQVFSLAAIHANGEEVEKEFGGHRPDHVGT